MASDVRPYLVPDSGLTLHPWQLWDGERWAPAPDYVPTWDPDTDLFLHRQVSSLQDDLRSQAALPPEAQLTLVVSWTSSSSGMTALAETQPLSTTGLNALEFRLPSAKLGGTITLRTRLCLAEPLRGARTAVASSAGAVLAEDEAKIRLEGEAARFPTTVVDFTHTRLHADASWHLQTASDLAAPFLGTYLLLINSRDEELVRAVADGPKRDPRTQLLLDDLEAGVAERLLEQALRRADELGEADWPPDSVGDALSRILRSGHAVVGDFRDADDASTLRTALDGSVRARGSGRQFI